MRRLRFLRNLLRLEDIIREHKLVAYKDNPIGLLNCQKCNISFQHWGFRPGSNWIDHILDVMSR